MSAPTPIIPMILAMIFGVAFVNLVGMFFQEFYLGRFLIDSGLIIATIVGGYFYSKAQNVND